MHDNVNRIANCPICLPTTHAVLNRDKPYGVTYNTLSKTVAITPYLVNCTKQVRTNILVGKMREQPAVLYATKGCVTQTPLCVCQVHISIVFANQ